MTEFPSARRCANDPNVLTLAREVIRLSPDNIGCSDKWKLAKAVIDLTAKLADMDSDEEAWMTTTRLLTERLQAAESDVAALRAELAAVARGDIPPRDEDE